MRTSLFACLLCAVCVCMFSPTVFAFTLDNPAYQVETYLRYDTENLGRCLDLTFDSAGNMYVAHTFDGSRSGSVQRIGLDKTVTTLCGGLVDPRHIVWGGGTQFGNYLYVSDRLNNSHSMYGEITRLDLAGNKSFFAGGLYQPASLTIDRSGNYNNKMYIANSAYDRILSVGPTGGTTTPFSAYPYGISGGIGGLAVDTTGNYAGKMFSGMASSDLRYAGLFYINTDGVEGRFADIEKAGPIAFDSTPEQSFDGKMYAAGYAGSDTRWSLLEVNGFFNTEVFGTFDLGETWTRPDVEFGIDGAMYVMEWDSFNQDVVISRITPIPEPASLMLLGLGCLFLKRTTKEA